MIVSFRSELVGLHCLPWPCLPDLVHFSPKLVVSEARHGRFWEGEVRPGRAWVVDWLVSHFHGGGGVKPSKFNSNLPLHDGAKLEVNVGSGGLLSLLEFSIVNADFVRTP